MANGGRRPGAGNKAGSKRKKTIEAETKAEELKRMLAPHIEEVVKALVAKSKTGDSTAMKEFFERAVGKVPQITDLKGDVSIMVKYANSRIDPGE